MFKKVGRTNISNTKTRKGGIKTMSKKNIERLQIMKRCLFQNMEA